MKQRERGGEGALRLGTLKRMRLKRLSTMIRRAIEDVDIDLEGIRMGTGDVDPDLEGTRRGIGGVDLDPEGTQRPGIGGVGRPESDLQTET
jgi:hypothetical protein